MYARIAKLGLGVGLALLVFTGTSQAAKTIKVQTVAGHPHVFRWVKHMSKTYIPSVVGLAPPHQ